MNEVSTIRPGEIATEPPAARDAGLEFIGLHRGVTVAIGRGRGPGTVRAEQIQPKHERLRLAALPFKPVHSGPHGSGRRRVVFLVGPERRTVAKELLPAGFPKLSVGIVLRRQAKAGLVFERDVPGARIIP